MGLREKISIDFILLLAFGTLFIFNCASDTRQEVFTLRPGDLLFQDLDGSPFCEAVEKVTQGYNGAQLTHVGIVISSSADSVIVLEAVSEGVVETPLATFLSRSQNQNGKPKVIVGRLRPRYRCLIEPALAAALAFKGKPYDDVFDIQNDAYYCSELVYVCFREANDGQPLFELQPMTFIDPDTKATFPAWQDYFNELQVAVPEGRPGLNPGSVSRSQALRIVYVYGFPDGWKTQN